MNASKICEISVIASLLVFAPLAGFASEVDEAESSYMPSLEKMYVSGILGASFPQTTLTGGSVPPAYPAQYTGQPLQGSTFTGGMALGLKLGDPAYPTRFEIEGRGRTPVSGPTNLQINNTDYGVSYGLPGTAKVSNMWSAMANVWQEYRIVRDLNLYFGGGVGAGGYTYSASNSISYGSDGSASVSGSNQASRFAWQVGAGATYDINEHFTLDLAYRHFAMLTNATPVNGYDSQGSFPYGTAYSAFHTNEILVSFRVQDPLGLF
jgi:opacity protein-like surface antigen